MRSRGWPVAAVAVAGAVLFQFFGNANRGYINTSSLFYWWGFQWSNPASEAQQGWLILGLSLWLFWRGLKSGEARPPPGRPRVFPILAGAVALHAVGFAVQQARVSIIALLLFIYGLAGLADLGRPENRRGIQRAAAFPLAFMLFAIPLNVLDSVGFWLRMGVIQVSAGIAHAVGIGVMRSGTLLLAPDGRYQYDVAAACSGIRSLMALAALSLLLGYISLAFNRLRALVFLSCVPLVFLGNVARITAIILAAQWGGPAWGDRVHDIMGWGIFVIVLGGVYAFAAWLTRFDKPGVVSEPVSHGCRAGVLHPPSLVDDGGCKTPALQGGAAAIVVLIGIAGLGLHWLSLQPPRGEAGVKLLADGTNPVDLPPYLGREWIGRPSEVTAVEREILPPDTGYSRRLYVPLQPVPDPRKAVFVSIVLSGRDRTSIHRPELCLVGQGWTIRDSTEHRFGDPSAPDGGFTAAVLHVEHKRPENGKTVVEPQLVAYWFVSSDATVSSHWSRILRDTWARLVHLRADRWAYVLLQTNADDGEPAALARMQAVLNQTLPVFRR